MKEFLASVKATNAEAPQALKVGFKEAAEVVAQEARRRAPVYRGPAKRGVKPGALRASIRTFATQRGAGIREGKASVPYAGFIDYGGTVGRMRTGNFSAVRGTGNQHVHYRARVARQARHFAQRPYIKTGRIMYPAFEAKRGEVQKLAGDALFRVAKQNGLEVSVHGYQ